MAPETRNDVGRESNKYTVFIDTSLDTHLATIISDSDTVSDLRNKILLEHRQCFPTIGDIKIHCLKVKRRGNFYHLSDSMLVKSAFSAIKTNWFVSVDASHLDQDVVIQPFNKHKARDQLALPWVTDSRSIDRHNNHGSPSVHPKIVPFVNQKSPTVDQLTSGDSCKNVSNNLEEDKSSNDKQLNSKVLEKMHTENNDVKSKKSTRDVDNESLLDGASGSGLSVKKKRKTRKGEGAVKALEKDKVSTFDTDEGINNDDSFEHKSQGKDLSDESTGINQGENCNALNQLAIVVPSQDAGEVKHPRKNVESSETAPDVNVESSETARYVAMAVEQNIQQEMLLEISQKEKDNELVQKTVMGNELPSSSMRTSDCERDAPGITPMGKHKAAEKESSFTSFIKKLHSINKDVIDSSQQDVGSTVQESAGNQIDKEKQGPEVKLPERRKRAKKTAAKNKDESLVKRSDNLEGDKDISSTVPAPVFDEKVIDERDEVSEKTSIDDSKKGNEMIVEEMEISEPTESLKSQLHVENVEENSRTVLEDTVRGRKKKKDAGKSASRNDESVVKHTSDAATVTNEEIVLPQSERKGSLEITSTDADISRNENNISQVNAEGIVDNSEKQNDTVRSRKKKKSASRNDESVIMHTSDAATVANEEIVLSQSERRESPEITLTDTEISRNEKNVSQVNTEGINGNLEKQNDTMDDTKKSKKKRRTKKATAINENESILKHANSDICGNVKEGENSLPDADKKDGDKVKEKYAQIFDEKVVKKAKKNQKSSVTVTPPQDLPSGRQSADLELESTKSQTVDHNHLPEEALNNVTVSEVSKGNNEADIPKDESHKIDFMDYFTPGRQAEKNASIDSGKDGKLSVKEKKTKKKTFKPPHLETTIQSQNIISENENNSSKVPTDAVRDPNKNTDQFKTPKRTKKIDPLKTVKSVHESSSSSSLKSFLRSVPNQKSNKQESVLGQTRVETSKKSAPGVKSVLNTSGTIFGNDNDESSADDNAAVSSDSSTRTPSRTSSSSGESDSSLDWRRNGALAVKRKGGGANSSMNSQSKKMSMSDLLRSSSRFKKAKLTASQVEDTESQQVDLGISLG